MTLLFFLEWGKRGLGFLWVLWAGVSAFILYKSIQKWKDPFLYQDLPDGSRITVPNEPRQSIFKVGYFQLLLILQGISFVIFILIETGATD